MKRDERELGSKWKRRKYLATLSGGALVTLAGCGGGSDGGDGGSDGGGGDSDGGVSTTFTQNTEAKNISSLHINTYNPTDVSGDLANVLFDPSGWYYRPGASYVGHIISEWDLTGDTYEITLNDGFSWHTGDPVTAEDLAIGYRLDVLTGASISDFVDGVEAVDSTTVELTPSQSISSNIAAFSIIPSQLNTPRMKYGSYVEEADDATTEDERTAVREKLIQWKWPVDEAYGNGAFELTNIGDIVYELELYDDHPFAGDIDITNWNIEQANEEQAFQSATSGELDGVQAGMTKTQVQNLKDAGWTAFGQPWGFGWFLMPHYDKLPVLRDRRVRKAIAYVIDKELATKDSIQFRPVKRPTGITQTWRGGVWELLDTDPETFISYEQDQEKATSLLEEADLTKDGDTWMTPDGEPFNLGEIPFVSKYAPVLNMWRSVVTQLNQFGIQAEMGGTTPAQWNTKLRNGDFTASNAAWGGFTTHPYQNIRWNLEGGTGTGYDVFHQTNFRNFDERGEDAYRVEIPPVGEPDAEPSETLDLLAAKEEIFSTNDKERQTELYRKIAWWHNWDLGLIILQEFDGPNTFISPDWQFPSDEDANVYGYANSLADFLVRDNLNSSG